MEHLPFLFNPNQQATPEEFERAEVAGGLLFGELVKQNFQDYGMSPEQFAALVDKNRPAMELPTDWAWGPMATHARVAFATSIKIGLGFYGLHAVDDVDLACGWVRLGK